MVIHNKNECLLISSICAAFFKGSHDILSQLHVVSLPWVVNAVLLEFSKDEPGYSESFFKWVELLSGYRHSLQPFWTMIQIHTRQMHFKSAQSLLKKIMFREQLSCPTTLHALMSKSKDHDTNSHILSWLIIFYAQANKIQDAIDVFHQTRVLNLNPRLDTCTVLLSSLVKVRATATAWKLWDEMSKRRITPNVYLYNVMLHACYVSGDSERAEELLKDMQYRGVPMDLISYNTSIALYSSKGMHFEALCAQEKMQREGIHPDIITYNSLICGFCRQGRMREAMKMFQEIRGSEPNLVTYTTMIDGFCKANNLSEGLRIWREMEAKGIYPGVVTFNAIIRKLCEKGSMTTAHDILNQMKDRKVEPDNVTCNTLINAYAKRGHMQSAWKVREKMLEAGLKLDLFTYKALIHGFCKSQEINEATETLIEMLQEGFPPSYNTYAWIVDGYCRQNNPEAALRIPEEIIRKGIDLDSSVYRAIIRRFCRKGMLDMAQKAFNQMKSGGMSGDGSFLQAHMAYAYLHAGKPAVASELLTEMAKSGFMITSKTYKSICASYSEDVDQLRLFWEYALEKGLLVKSVCKLLQNSSNPTVTQMKN